MGSGGNDLAAGEKGPDKILGAAGDDWLIDGELRGGQTDNLGGGDGDDLLDAINQPAKRDILP